MTIETKLTQIWPAIVTSFVTTVVTMFLCTTFMSCGGNNPAHAEKEKTPVIVPQTRWDYKLLTVNAPNHERIGDNALAANDLLVPDKDLTQLGIDGWELASNYLEMETSFPNLGRAQYNTGIQSNIRPKRVVLIFKRPIR